VRLAAVRLPHRCDGGVHTEDLEYRTFFLDPVRQAGLAERDVDKALMAFGRFLRTDLARALLGLPT